LINPEHGHQAQDQDGEDGKAWAALHPFPHYPPSACTAVY
jgi:hypothetical protein